MQATMSLLEGHASWVMNEVGSTTIRDLARMRRSLKQRRQAGGMERGFQRAIGFDQKVRQYDAGEAFVRGVVERVGVGGLNRVWERDTNLPSIDEIAAPERWIARVAAA
jgi:putative hydrolase